MNSKSIPIFKKFTQNVNEALQDLGVSAPLYFVKSDAALLNSRMASKIPAVTIKSGPAVSTLGLFGLTGVKNGLALDIGGTTTDIGIITGTSPKIEENLKIAGYRTAFSSIDSVDIPLGGDSEVVAKSGSGDIKVKERRRGPAAAFGGNHPTLTDALHVLGEFNLGNRERSLEVLNGLSEDVAWMWKNWRKVLSTSLPKVFRIM